MALQGAATDAFQVRGEHTGALGAPLVPGLAFAAVSAGWAVEVVAGAWMDLGDAGPASSGGVRVDSILEEADGTTTAWTSLTSRSGEQVIGLATVEEDGHFVSVEEPVFSGGDDAFERSGVSHPVVFADGDGYRMLYAGKRNNRLSVGLATSDDGISWTAQGEVLRARSGDWDRISVVPNRVEPLPEGGWRLWYSGYDGSRWRIGSATSTDGDSWSTDSAPRGYQFGLGEPGTWDDSGVKDAWVITDETGEHLWYSGFDGDAWRIGYAFRAEGEQAFTRPVLAGTDDPRYLIDYVDSPFHRTDVTRPSSSRRKTALR